VARDRFTTWLLAVFAAVAVALALIGIHGVIAYTVGRQTREFGIRIALGATRTEVLAMVVGQGLRLAVVGALLGLLGAYAGARALDSLLFGVTATDPLTFAVVTVMLLLVATGACYVAARPAAGLDPATALRQE
jgi:ABC-type antimicrobial peptide transport system permease subunit